MEGQVYVTIVINNCIPTLSTNIIIYADFGFSGTPCIYSQDNISQKHTMQVYHVKDAKHRTFPYDSGVKVVYQK